MSPQKSERPREESRIPKPRNSAGRNVPVAITVGIALAALALFAVFMGPWLWYPLLAIVAAMATWEVTRRLREKDWLVPTIPLMVGSQLIIWLPWAFDVLGLVLGLIVTVFAVLVTRLFNNGAAVGPNDWLRDASVGVFIAAWIPTTLSFGAMLSTLEIDNGVDPRLYIISFMMCVVASDVGGYAAGVFFGRHPMAPAISPKKSWEGFAGSMVLGITAGICAALFLIDRPFWFGIAFGIGMVIAATLGDLVESQFKRDLGVKDMSNLIPAHGGLMDRLDGMLPAATVSWMLLVLV